MGHLNNFEGPVFDSSSLRGARRPAKKEMLELKIPGYSHMGCWENFTVEPPITSQIYQIRNLGSKPWVSICFSVEKLECLYLIEKSVIFLGDLEPLSQLRFRCGGLRGSYGGPGRQFWSCYVGGQGAETIAICQVVRQLPSGYLT